METHILLRRSLGQHVSVANVVDVDIVGELGIVRVPEPAATRNAAGRVLGRDFCRNGGSSCCSLRRSLAILCLDRLRGRVLAILALRASFVPLALRGRHGRWKERVNTCVASPPSLQHLHSNSFAVPAAA
jgi:hypothetical protein